MSNYVGQQLESEELNKILQALLQINGSLRRLNTETDEMSIVLPKLDWLYIVRIIEQNKTSKVGKFYSKEVGDNFFKLGNIKIKHSGES